MVEADPGAEALLGVLKEQSSRRLRDHGQGAPGPGEVPESFLEEVTPEFRLEEGEVKREGIPGRVGSLRKKNRRVHWARPGTAGMCRAGEARAERTAGLPDHSKKKPWEALVQIQSCLW